MARKTRKNSKVEDEIISTSTSSTSSTEEKTVKKKSSSPARKRTKKSTTECNGLDILNEPMELLENFVKTFQMEETQEITEKEGAAFWKARYEELFSLRMTEPEELQKDAMAINEEEQKLTRKKEQAQQKKILELEKTNEDLQKTNEDLRLEVAQQTAAKIAALDEQINEGIKKVQAANDALIDERKALKAENDKLTDERKTLKAMVKKLSAEKTSSTAQITQNAAEQSNLAMKLTQFTSVLDIFQILTTLNINLLVNDNNENDKATEDSEKYVDVICTASNAANPKKKIVFELSVSSSATDQIDCLPRPDLSTVEKFPTFLEEEISFDRPMAPMFLKAMLDAINTPSS